MHERIMAKRLELNIISESEPLPQAEFVKIQNEVHDNFESVRSDIWKLMMEENNVENKKPRKMMQKAYATFATVAQYEKDFKPDQAERSRWADQVSVIAQQHTKYISEFEKGQFYGGVDRNPRLSKDSDEKVALKSGVEESVVEKEDLTLKRRVTLKADSTNVQ